VIRPEDKVTPRERFSRDIPRRELKALLKRDDWHAGAG
jgi:hypothetical protein